MPQDRNYKKNISGNLIKEPSEAFVVSSSNPAVEFDFSAVQPLVGIYVDVNDQFVITCMSGGGNQMTANLRILGFDGVVRPMQLGPLNLVSTIVNTFRFQLIEGFLISAVATASAPGDSGSNFLYAEMSLERAPFGTQNKYASLWAGKIYQNVAFGYPQSPYQGPTDGAGSTSSLGFVAPAAGADIVIAVPALARWRVISFRATLTTAVAVANRNVSITYDDGVNVVVESLSNFVQAASIVNTYNAFDSAPYVNAPFNLRTQQPLPSATFIGPGWHVNTATAGIQAADQWSAARLLVQAWPDLP